VNQVNRSIRDRLTAARLKKFNNRF